MHEAGHPKLALWDNQRDRVGREVGSEGTHLYLWLINVDVWQKKSQYCKVAILQLK